MLGLATYVGIVRRGLKRTPALYVCGARTWSDWMGLWMVYRASASDWSWDLPVSDRIPDTRKDRLWRWISDVVTWDVADLIGTFAGIDAGDQPSKSVWYLCTEKRAAIGSFSDDCLSDGRMGMKKKGRYVVEAAMLIPGISILLVYLVFFTLYAHDYAVCTHTAVESGIKGLYPDGSTDKQRKEKIEQDLRQKLSTRLLWMREEEVSVQVNPVRLKIQISGKGNFLPVDDILVERELYRIQPCQIIRRCRWMEDKDGDTV